MVASVPISAYTYVVRPCESTPSIVAVKGALGGSMGFKIVTSTGAGAGAATATESMSDYFAGRQK